MMLGVDVTADSRLKPLAWSEGKQPDDTVLHSLDKLSDFLMMIRQYYSTDSTDSDKKVQLSQATWAH